MGGGGRVEIRIENELNRIEYKMGLTKLSQTSGPAKKKTAGNVKGFT